MPRGTDRLGLLDQSRIADAVVSGESTSRAGLASSTNIASLTEAIKSHPNDPQAYNLRGSVLAQAGKPRRRWPISTRPSGSIRITGRLTPIAG